MKKITILLPIHILNDDYVTMLKNALTSIEDFHNDIDLLIICPKNIITILEDFNFGQKLNVKLIENTTENFDFTSQINIGIDNCETEWFSIMEIDDEYKKNWVKLMNDYMIENNDVDVFLPVVKDINQNGDFLSFTNESVWAYGFCEKQGYLDKEVLLEFQNYQTSGGLFKTQVIKDNGKLKNNIKLTFMYEFLLRLLHNGVKIMSIPKIGYQHVNFREDSLFWKYQNDVEFKLSEKEIKFWVETAKKEYFFKNKRDITYMET